MGSSTQFLSPHRTIRSFVNREGRMTTAQSQAYAAMWPEYGIENGEALLDFVTLFDRIAPVVLEIGFGMGRSLAAMAQQYPQNNYIGIEVYRTGIGALFVELQKNNIHNIRVLCADAVTILTQRIPDNSIDCLQIFFPDPWPKKRHHKRRLIQENFVKLIQQKLKNNGILHLATDWEDYANHMQAVLKQFPEFVLMTPEQAENKQLMQRPQTKYEQRGKKLGHGIWDLHYIKA